MDLPALPTILFLHGNRLVLAQEWSRPPGQRAGLWPSWMSYSQHDDVRPCGRADVGTRQTSGRTTGQHDAQGENIMTAQAGVKLNYLPPTTEEVNAITRDVCLSVCQQDYSKTRAWISMTVCVSTGVGTWTNLSTFEPDPDHSLDAGTGIAFSHSVCTATWNFITSGKSHVPEAATRGFEASKHRCRR